MRRCNRSVVCDAITVKGEKITKSPAQLSATYDLKGPLKGRTKRQRVRKNRTLRVLGPVQTPEREAAECIDVTHGNDMQTPAKALATPSGTRSDLDNAYGLPVEVLLPNVLHLTAGDTVASFIRKSALFSACRTSSLAVSISSSFGTA